MKIAIAAVSSLLLGIGLLPAVLAGGDAPAPALCSQPAGPMGVILGTIREIESGGDYQADAAGSTASGAYQFVDDSWGGYGGYLHAGDAPPEVQDAKAAEHVGDILDDHGGDIAAVPVVWYLGHLPEPGSPEWDQVPAPEAGNQLTPREYRDKWMTAYQANVDTDAPGRVPSVTGECVGGSIPPLPGGWSLPGPRHLIDANPAVLDDPHHDYPAWDWLIPEGTPIYAVHGGRVSSVRTWPHNWWDQGCDTNSSVGCDTCGVGLTIVDEDDNRWTYCHGSSLTVGPGTAVRAGDQIMWSGNTGRSGAPHLHIEVRVDGARHCPQPLLQSVYTDLVGLEPTALPATGCTS